jgi:hypothetical protein
MPAELGSALLHTLTSAIQGMTEAMHGKLLVLTGGFRWTPGYHPTVYCAPRE